MQELNLKDNISLEQENSPRTNKTYYLIIKGEAQKFQLEKKNTLSKQHQAPVFTFKNYNEFERLVNGQMSNHIMGSDDGTNLTEPNNELYSKDQTDSQHENILQDKNLVKGYLYIMINKLAGSFLEVKISEAKKEVQIFDDEQLKSLSGVQNVFTLCEYKLDREIFEDNSEVLGFHEQSAHF